MELSRSLRNFDSLLYPYYNRSLDNLFFNDTQKGFNMDMKENVSNYLINADIPGVNKSDIKVSIHNDMLVISTERSESKEENDEHTHFSERTYGSYTRSIRLPSNSNINLLSAKYENGVLSVNIPKNNITAPRSRNVSIQ